MCHDIISLASVYFRCQNFSPVVCVNHFSPYIIYNIFLSLAVIIISLYH